MACFLASELVREMPIRPESSDAPGPRSQSPNQQRWARL